VNPHETLTEALLVDVPQAPDAGTTEMITLSEDPAMAEDESIPATNH